MTAGIVRTATRDVCEICAVPIEDDHPHVVDVRDRRLLCSCRPCHMLFVPAGAAQGRYRAVPQRFDALPGSLNFDALQIPIGLAFFFYNSATQRINAFYPAAAGATESELTLDAWDALAREEPLLASLQPDTEAVLVYRRRDGESEAYIVPVDVCYELVALVRMSWEGFDGGDGVRARIDDVLTGIRERCS